MENVKNFINKYKVQIITILGALVTFFVTLEGIGGTAAVIFAIIAAVISAVVYFLKNGFDDTLVNMGVAIVKMILEAVNTKAVNNNIMSANKPMTNKEIKEKLLAYMKEQ